MKLLAAEEKHLSGFFLRVVNFHERWLRRALERPRLLVDFQRRADRRFLRLLQLLRFGLAAGNG